MKKTLIALSALSATAFISATAMADEHPSKNPDDKSTTTQAQFESLDRNADEKLSKTEASADESLSVQFASLDRDSDGYVNKSEYKAGSKSQQPEPPTSREPY